MTEIIDYGRFGGGGARRPRYLSGSEAWELEPYFGSLLFTGSVSTPGGHETSLDMGFPAGPGS
ncbi:hypothetical protein GCM10010404_89280 [Nonomuraea africana]